MSSPYGPVVRHGRSFLVALALGAPALVLVAPAPPAAASPTVLPAGQVREITAPGMALVTPADGRLRGPAFTASVTGVAWPGSAAPVTPADLVPAPGDRLVVFALQVTEPTTVVSGTSGGAPLSADLTFGPSAASVPLGAITAAIESIYAGGPTATGTETLVASVPVHEHAVDLVLSQAGFSQTFSLWHLTRVPPAPTVLYRDPSSSTVASATLPSGHLLLSDAATHFHQPALVTTDSAVLSYFAPGSGGQTAPNPKEAELVVQLEADASQGPLGFYLWATSSLAGDRLVLHVPGHAPVTGATSPMLNTSTGQNDDGLLDATYSFVVPADVTTATLDITPGTTPGEQYEDFHTPGPSSFDVAKGTSLVLRFPAPPEVATQPPVHWPSAASLASYAASPGHFSGKAVPAGGGLPWPLVAALVLVAVSLVVAGWRSRRGRALVERWRRRLSAAAPADTDPVTDAVTDAASDVATATDAGTPPSAAPEASADEPPPAGPAPTGVEGGGTMALVGDLRPVSPGGDGPRVHVLGSVELTGWRQRPQRRIVEELLCYLTLHPERPQGPEDLLSALWPLGSDDTEAKEATRATLRTYVSMLRRSVGAEHVPDASATDGYRVLEVGSDWADFEGLVAEARQAGEEEAIALRAKALRLVRGRPFAGVDTKRYAWAFSEGLAATMTAAVVRCAEHLGRSLLEAGDPQGAEAAAWAGLRVSTHEELLWELLLDAAAAGPTRGRLLHALQDAERSLGRARGLELRRRYLRDEGSRSGEPAPPHGRASAVEER
ncbi:MAG: hypothetical protein M0T71_11665 [Actinomycetota bacterium]|nr:hypothetical protein [Actinomycetota bacterium]